MGLSGGNISRILEGPGMKRPRLETVRRLLRLAGDAKWLLMETQFGVPLEEGTLIDLVSSTMVLVPPGLWILLVYLAPKGWTEAGGV